MPSVRAPSLQEVPKVFAAAQHSVSSHRRGIQTLHKVFTVQANHTTRVEHGAVKLTGEKDFMLAFRSCVDHLLDVKKGVVQADRVVKFVAEFLAFALDHASKSKPTDADSSDEEDDDTPASRLAAALLKHLLKGFPAANKNVRYRCCQLVAYMMSAIPELDEDLFSLLKTSLLERVRDREPNVRVQAVIALAKLQNATSGEDDAEDDAATRALMDAMAHDSSAQARRAALFQLDLTPSLLAPVLNRIRDVDINNRRYIFQGKLAEVPATALSLDQRTQVIKSGLKDREAAVQRSASRLVAKWAGEDLVAFVASFDIVNHQDQLAVVSEALKAVFDNRPDLAADLDFTGAFACGLRRPCLRGA
jgi:condensin complex subunit 3